MIKFYPFYIQLIRIIFVGFFTQIFNYKKSNSYVTRTKIQNIHWKHSLRKIASVMKTFNYLQHAYHTLVQYKKGKKKISPETDKFTMKIL